MRWEIRLAGSGGQGLITAAVILAEAAGLREGRYVTQTQSYGPEARGGACKAEVVVSDAPIHYPKARRLDVLLALTQEACDRYYPDLKPGGLLIVDAELVPNPPTSAAISVPLAQLARERLGRSHFVSTAALGALAGATGAISGDALIAAILQRTPHGTEKDNRRAFELGFAEGREAMSRQVPETVVADE